MGLKRYPLDALEQLRDRRVEDATTRLAAAHSLEDAAKQALERACVRERAVQIAHDDVRDQERRALEEGALLVEDLARAAAWQVGAELERSAAASASCAARNALDERALDRQRAHDGLVMMSADAKVVENHHADWSAREAEVGLAVEEMEMEDAWRRRR